MLEHQYEEAQVSIPSFPHSVLQLGYHRPWQAITRTGLQSMIHHQALGLWYVYAWRAVSR